MLNWLVIGIGDITRKRVIPAILAEPRSNLYAILTRDPAKAAPYNTIAYTSLDTALADPNIQAVYVASPVYLHAPQSIAALKAGKHVLCEKPLALNYAEAQSMQFAAQQSGKILAAAYYRRLYPKIIRAKQLIAQGAIGQPILAEATCHGWLESEERAWLRDPAIAGGGPLFDIASHRIDACNFLFGPPLAATGILSNTVHHLKVEDSATTLIQYANGIHATVDVRWNSRIPRDEFRILGTTGELLLTPLAAPTLFIRTANSTVVAEENLPTHENVHYPIIEDFTSAILNNHAPAAPIAEAIQTDLVTHWVMQSNPRA